MKNIIIFFEISCLGVPGGVFLMAQKGPKIDTFCDFGPINLKFGLRSLRGCYEVMKVF